MLEYSEWVDRARFDTADAWGLSSMLDVRGVDLATISDPIRIERFIIELCHLLKVRRFGNPQIIRFGDDPTVYGYSAVQLIETSLVSAHFVELSRTAYIDIFSCKWYDIRSIRIFALKYLSGTSIATKQTLRI